MLLSAFAFSVLFCFVHSQRWAFRYSHHPPVFVGNFFRRLSCKRVLFFVSATIRSLRLGFSSLSQLTNYLFLYSCFICVLPFAHSLHYYTMNVSQRSLRIGFLLHSLCILQFVRSLCRFLSFLLNLLLLYFSYCYYNHRHRCCRCRCVVCVIISTVVIAKPVILLLSQLLWGRGDLYVSPLSRTYI